MIDRNRPLVAGDSLPFGFLHLELKPLRIYDDRRFIESNFGGDNIAANNNYHHHINGRWWDIRRSNISINKPDSNEAAETKHYQLQFQKFAPQFISVIKNFVSPQFEEIIPATATSHSFIASFIHSVRTAIINYLTSTGYNPQNLISYFGSNHCVGFNGHKVRNYVRHCRVHPSETEGCVLVESEHIGNWKTPWKFVEVDVIEAPHLLMALFLPQICSHCSISKQIASWLDNSSLSIDRKAQGNILITNQFCKLMTLAQLEIRSLELNQISDGYNTRVTVGFALGSVNEAYTESIQKLLWPNITYVPMEPPQTTPVDTGYSDLPPLALEEF
jgi:hypothetical protein